ncbi:MAG: (2Fe-2S)-binding protein [Ideonella sp. MAG2]|nr:MAG: (2Fe-2S)-binding protein [Ideonella sp. MAG2]
MDLTINGQRRPLDPNRVPSDKPSDMPLLWVLRDELGMTGTKFGCGVAACGACTVQVDGQAVRACVTPVSSAQGKAVRTIEALGSGDKPHALQQAWIDHQVPQCGYCQSGMLMAAEALLRAKPNPTEADIDAAITNLCRCGTYPRVKAAIQSAAKALRGGQV